MKLSVNGSNSGSVVLYVEYEPYERYESSGIRKARIRRDSIEECFYTLVDNLRLYFYSADIEDDGLTVEEVVEKICDSNGDGCDFISFLKNETTGEVYIDEGYEETDEW